MTDSKALNPSQKKCTPWQAALPSVLLALAPLVACGPGQVEAPAAQVAEPAGSQAEPGVTAAEAGPPELAERSEEAAPEPAPLGPELEAPPAREEPAAEALTEPPVAPEPEMEMEEAEPMAPPPAALPRAEDPTAGKEVFLGQRCNTCHTVSTAGIEAKVKSGSTAGPDLAGVGGRRDRASIEAILHQEEPVNGKKHPKRFSGTQQELDALIDWLLSPG
jgi:cytochrome c2